MPRAVKRRFKTFEAADEAASLISRGCDDVVSIDVDCVARRFEVRIGNDRRAPYWRQRRIDVRTVLREVATGKLYHVEAKTVDPAGREFVTLKHIASSERRAVYLPLGEAWFREGSV